MAIQNKINGVIRDVSETFSKINGVWRNNVSSLTKINGVWRNSHNNTITSDNIIGFKLIYTLNQSRIYTDNPRLKYNKKIPYSFKLTGDNIGIMDLSMKGVVFEYKRDEPEEEGIIMYEGRLYAVLPNGSLINVCQVYNGSNKKVSEITNIHNTSILRNLDIKLSGYVLFEDYGYYFAGWNNLFNTEAFIDQTIYPDKYSYKKKLQLNSYNILPIHMRDDDFDSVSTIGIARDMETPIYNMNGSHGLLDHTITKISVNGINKPFVIEIN